MSRTPRNLPPGVIAHITNRGAAGLDIFRADGDRQLFLWLVAAQAVERQWACHAFCLMGNHYHLLLQAPEGDLSQGMRAIGLGYAKVFNHVYERVGHVFQSRFRAVAVEHDEHALELARYIALNPVRAGLVQRPEHWRWSSYAVVVNGGWVPEGLESGWFVKRFGGRDGLRRFVEAGLRAENL